MITKNKLFPFSASEITPTGWYKEQLTTQLNGLSGNLHKFWPDIKDSKWIGGDKEGWERVPYWLDGYIPLVYLLNDKEGKETVDFYINSIISKQKKDGWIAPCKDEERNSYDAWGIFIIIKALHTYYLATHKENILDVIYKVLLNLNRHIEYAPLYNWAQFRWFEPLIVIEDVYKKYQDKRLLELSEKLIEEGFDYLNFAKHNIATKKVKTGEWSYTNHIVNNVMAVKAYALLNKYHSSRTNEKGSDYFLKKLNKYHGAITGAINGDECFSGLNPNQGSELCSIVELMYSLEQLNEITGKTIYQEQLERLAFNALPSALTSDMWAHQYVDCVNQPLIIRSEKHLWTTNGPETNLYGLEPHYGCCTANFNQGFPKFALSTVYKKDNGLRINSYIPLEINSEDFKIKIESSYPFVLDNISITITSKKDSFVEFLIPTWATRFTINNKENSGDLQGFSLKTGENHFKISIESKPKFIKRKIGYSLVDGPLVYALKIKEEFKQVNTEDPMKAFPHADYEIYPQEDFNFGLINFDYKIESHHYDGKSIFVNKVYPKSYVLKCAQIKYKQKGNYILFKNEQINKDIVEKEFIPIGVNKLHLGEVLLVKGDKNEDF